MGTIDKLSYKSNISKWIRRAVITDNWGRLAEHLRLLQCHMNGPGLTTPLQQHNCSAWGRRLLGLCVQIANLKFLCCKGQKQKDTRLWIKARAVRLVLCILCTGANSAAWMQTRTCSCKQMEVPHKRGEWLQPSWFPQRQQKPKVGKKHANTLCAIHCMQVRTSLSHTSTLTPTPALCDNRKATQQQAVVPAGRAAAALRPTPPGLHRGCTQLLQPLCLLQQLLQGFAPGVGETDSNIELSYFNCSLVGVKWELEQNNAHIVFADERTKYAHFWDDFWMLLHFQGEFNIYS